MARAFIFPGQGSQAVGMGKALADSFPAARAVFDEVDSALGEKLTAIIWDGPGETLQLTRTNADYYALQLGNHVLGGGFYATRLYHDLRQVSGLVYTVDLRLDASKTRANFAVTYGCNPENVSKARALIQRDLQQMRAQDVSADELHQAKALLLRQISLNESSEEAMAHGLLARADIGLPLDEPILAAAKYYSLSAEQVKAAFSRLIRPDDFVQVVRGPTAH